jgi:hypothetical protein
VAWIRRVRTASGATAVQIAESVGGRRKIAAHVGSAHTEAELGILLERAREMLAILPRARSTWTSSLLHRRSGSWRRRPGLCCSKRSAPAAAAPPRVVSTDSRVLFEALDGIFAALGFGTLGDEAFRDLVLARVVEPTWVLDAGRVLADLGRKAASDKTMRRTLVRWTRLPRRDRRDVLRTRAGQRQSFSRPVRRDDAVLRGRERKRPAQSRLLQGTAGRPSDRGGTAGRPARVPPGHRLLRGSQAEKLTILPVIRQFQARHGIEGMVVVADGGMLSAANLAELGTAGLGFIVGSRVTKAPVDLESHFRWHGDTLDDGQVIDTLTPKTGRNGDNDPARRAEPVWDPTAHPASWRAVWAFSARRFARDNKTLTAQENRARDVISAAKSARTPRFVKTADGARAPDEKALARARRLAGLKGYVTNIPSP